MDDEFAAMDERKAQAKATILSDAESASEFQRFQPLVRKLSAASLAALTVAVNEEAARRYEAQTRWYPPPAPNGSRLRDGGTHDG